MTFTESKLDFSSEDFGFYIKPKLNQNVAKNQTEIIKRFLFKIHKVSKRILILGGK